MQSYLKFYIKAATYILAVLLFIAPRAYGFDLSKDVVEYELPNGMRWILVERHQAPVFSGVIMLRVGGADEKPGKTGLAHVFEHMAFKGSKTIGTKDFSKEKPILDKIEKLGTLITIEEKKTSPDEMKVEGLKKEMASLMEQAASYQLKNELWEIMARNGAADLNAYTSKDVTAYHASMPINKVELWMDMVSQMVNEPVYREFFTERDVILEERRAGTENDPNGKMAEVILKNSFQEGPYSWPVIGDLEDVSSFTVKDARDFHDKYYTAANMVGVLVGDFNVKDVEKLIQKYFGDIPSSKPVADGQSSANKGKGLVEFAFEAEPALALSYHKPTLPNPDEFVFDVIQVLLCDGPTSRLQKKLIYDEKVARVVYCSDSFPGSRFDNLFLVWAEPNSGTKPEELASKIRAQLEELKEQPVSNEELERVRKKVTASIIYALESNMGLAMSLGDFETIFGDWRLLVNYPQMVEKVDVTDVMRVAKRYFTDDNETRVIRLKGKNTDVSK